MEMVCHPGFVEVDEERSECCQSQNNYNVRVVWVLGGFGPFIILNMHLCNELSYLGTRAENTIVNGCQRHIADTCLCP
jgi:hypothetical protein